MRKRPDNPMSGMKFPAERWQARFEEMSCEPGSVEEMIQLSAFVHGVSNGSAREAVNFRSFHSPGAAEEMIQDMNIEHDERISESGEHVKGWCQGTSLKPGTPERMEWSQTKKESLLMLYKREEGVGGNWSSQLRRNKGMVVAMRAISHVRFEMSRCEIACEPKIFQRAGWSIEHLRGKYITTNTHE